MANIYKKKCQVHYSNGTCKGILKYILNCLKDDRLLISNNLLTLTNLLYSRDIRSMVLLKSHDLRCVFSEKVIQERDRYLYMNL